MSYKNFSKEYKKVLINAENKAKEMWFKNVTEWDIFWEILESANWPLKDLFSLYGINKKIMLEVLNTPNFKQENIDRKWVYAGMNKELKSTILASVKIAVSLSKPFAGPEDFLLALIREKTWFMKILEFIGINPSDFDTNLVEISKNFSESIWELANQGDMQWVDKILWAITENIFWELANSMMTPFAEQSNNQKTESNTPALDFFSTNLTWDAVDWKIDNIIGRDDEIERLIAILNRKTKNNPVLVWEPWVGKTAIVEWLALRIAQWNVPFSMKEKKILALDMSSLVAGTKYRWEFEARIKQIIEEASKIENEVILFIDEIHTIIWAWWAEGTLDASNILKPAMGRGKIRIVGATTLKEYQKYIEKDSALERRFQRIKVDEPDTQTAIKVMEWLKDIFEEYHNLNISKEAIEESVRLSKRYITDRQLPDKAIDLVDEACSLKSMKYNHDEKEIKKLKEKVSELQKKIESSVISQQYKKAYTLKEEQKKLEEKISLKRRKFNIPKEKRMSIMPFDIQKVLSISTWIPVAELSKNDIDKLKNISKVLKSKIIGQDEWVESVVSSIMRSKAGIASPSRPLGSFLFLGPTGVGKTELVKTLAKEFYWDEESLIKVDMSEFSDKTSVSKLIWASAGYVWYEEWGILTEKVRKKPYSIVLFDEIEKWDLEVYNLLLQVLEEWELTDNKWRKINFKNTIVIMTSNIGHEEFSAKASQIWFDVSSNEEEKAKKDFAKARENIVNNLTDYFPPEFINRIDKVVVFNPLNKKAIKKIVWLHLEEFNNRLKEKNLYIKYDAKVINTIAKEVYNPEFWAREIRRYLQDNIEDKIANLLISGTKNDIFTIQMDKKKGLIVK